jgi:site-specific recombinase XerD
LIRIPGVNTTTKTNKRTGKVKKYYYHRKTGKRLPDDPNSIEFRLEVARLDQTPIGPAPAEKTFKALMQEYLKSSVFTELAATTQAEYRRHLKYLEPTLGPFLVRALRAKHVEALKQKYKANPTLAKAIGRTVSVVLSYAVFPLEWLPSNHLIRPKHGGGGRRRQKVVGQRPYEEAELAQFRERIRLGTRARLTFEIALGTALRRDDLPRVPAWAMTCESFSIVAGKNGELVVLPVTAAMRQAYLAYTAEREARGLPSSDLAISSERGTKLHKRTVSEDIEEACKAAELPDDQRLHALRYTAATRLFEAGVSYYTVQELTGHRMAEMAKKYVEKKRAAPLKAQVFNAADAAQAAAAHH